MGDQHLTLNYTRTLADYINNFTFGKGVQFKVPEANNAIIPHLLQKVWEGDNDKQKVLWEMGQLAAVAGDCFVKIAYEDAWEDTLGVIHEGRTRIIPLNPAHCFPEYHPHDRDRILRFKLKYRFWGTSPEGTRQVYTFTEILTDETIEQYINDELIDQYENPIGTIPVVHIPNVTISSSPWGQSDIWDIISLNREMNEKMTEASDIINYHSAPVTIVTGAKAHQLERGAKKMWAGLPADAKVYNLESKGEMAGILEFIQFVKMAMHEITGVPESALGQTQPISNTSGVALAIQYQPMMNRYHMKKVHFSKGLERVNELIIRTQAVHEPYTLTWDETQATYPEPDQAVILDPRDPNTYKTTIHWPDPLPVDELILLNELQAKMAMGLESKRGALRALGEEFPNEKMAEIYEELRDDLMDQGSLDLISAQIGAAIQYLTGMVMPEGAQPADVTTAGDASTSSSSESGDSGGVLPGVLPTPSQDVLNQLAQRAFGANLAQRRIPGSDSD